MSFGEICDCGTGCDFHRAVFLQHEEKHSRFALFPSIYNALQCVFQRRDTLRRRAEKMEEEYEDDYSDFIYLHPAESFADEKATHPSSNSIGPSKNAKSDSAPLHPKKPKRNRSKMRDPKYREFLQRGEYNPFLHNAWRLMGEAQYLNGDFLGAAATFMYIERYFTWMPELITEAKIWQLRSYSALGWTNEAENVVARLKPEELTNKRLKKLYNTAYGGFLVRTKQYAQAAPVLNAAVEATGGAQKTRLSFLLGQVYEANGDNANAYRMFKRVAGAPNATYRTQFNARIKQSEVFSGTNIESEVKSFVANDTPRPQ